MRQKMPVCAQNAKMKVNIRQRQLLAAAAAAALKNWQSQPKAPAT